MYSKQQLGYIRNNERAALKELKSKENKNIKIELSDNFINSKEFTFEKIDNNGDSGGLLLATNKKEKNQNYIIKHEHYDCACNEYMYYKIANELNINVARVKLVIIDDKKEYFKSDFACAIEYLEDASHVDYNYIMKNKENIKNYDDYFKYLALEALLFEGDGIEILLKNNHIYRIDTTDAFTLNEGDISYLAYDYNSNGINIREFAIKNILERAKVQNNCLLAQWKIAYNNFKEKYKKEYLDIYLNVYSDFLKLNENKVKEWANDIGYIYPNVISAYYIEFIKNLKNKVKTFLDKVGK